MERHTKDNRVVLKNSAPSGKQRRASRAAVAHEKRISKQDSPCHTYPVLIVGPDIRRACLLPPSAPRKHLGMLSRSFPFRRNRTSDCRHLNLLPFDASFSTTIPNIVPLGHELLFLTTRACHHAEPSTQHRTPQNRLSRTYRDTAQSIQASQYRLTTRYRLETESPSPSKRRTRFHSTCSSISRSPYPNANLRLSSSTPCRAS